MGRFTKEATMAKKKYYQGKKDRKDESKGMKRKLAGDYGSMEMFKDDKSAFAYVPQNVMSYKFPMNDYNNEYNQEGRSYQDMQMDAMAAQSAKQKMNKHF